MSDSLESLNINQILDIVKVALCNGFLDLKKYDIKKISFSNNSVLIYYIPKVENVIAIYSDICQIMAFISSFAGKELKKMGVYHIGVEAVNESKASSENIYIVSPISAAEDAGKGNIKKWLNNSITNEPITAQKEVLLLVEGSTEINTYPILFESAGYPITAHRIELFAYSEHNLRTLLTILEFKESHYYLVCDNDKSDEIKSLDRGGYFKLSEYHILQNGEFEDYVEPEILVEILENMNPGIGITIEYIEANRKKGKLTSKIIQEYYYRFGKEQVFPGKPKLGEEIAYFWVRNGIPKEIEDIIFSVMNIS